VDDGGIKQTGLTTHPLVSYDAARSTEETKMTQLEKDYQFYLDHQDEYVRKYRGRFIVIKNGTVLGDYGEKMVAITETMKQGHERGTFLVQKCEPGTCTMTYTSRVSFG